MEKPQYGRTGLLASRLGGLPVVQPRLLVPGSANATASRPLKWYPSLLTVPQQLLDALHREDNDEDSEGEENEGSSLPHFSADSTLGTFLRVATIAETLLQHWRRVASTAGSPSRAQMAAVYQEVMTWARERVNTSPAPASASHVTFSVPRYNLLVMKDERKVTEVSDITRRSVWLLGKEPVVNDVALDHPSCSAQHAALEMRFVPTDEAALTDIIVDGERAASATTSSSSSLPLFSRDKAALHSLCEGLWSMLDESLTAAGGDLTAVWSVELQLVDLGSTNRTKLNGEVLRAMESSTVIGSDVFEFGCSTRKYVVMRSA